MTKNLKFDLVYVTHDSLSEGIGMSQILPLLSNISRNGWDVCVISCEKDGIDSRVQEMLSKWSVTWRPIPFGRNGALGGLGRLIRLALNLPNGVVYHCRSDIAAVATAMRGKNFLWDVRGLWTDQKIVMKTITNNKLITWLSLRLERIAANRSCYVVTLTERIRPVLEERYPKMTKEWSVIPTCTNLELFKLRQIKSDSLLLVLSGVYNDYYDLKMTKQFVSQFRLTNHLDVWWVHGKEADKKELDVGEDVIFSVTQIEMPDVLSQSTFGLAFCKKDAGVSLRGVMPTKIAEFLATGRPVVVNEGIGDLDKIINEFNCGVIINDQSEILAGIEELKDLICDVDLSNRCRKAAEKYFDMSKASLKYLEAYRNIQTRGTRSIK